MQGQLFNQLFNHAQLFNDGRCVPVMTRCVFLSCACAAAKFILENNYFPVNNPEPNFREERFVLAEVCLWPYLYCAHTL